MTSAVPSEAARLGEASNAKVWGMLAFHAAVLAVVAVFIDTASNVAGLVVAIVMVVYAAMWVAAATLVLAIRRWDGSP